MGIQLQQVLADVPETEKAKAITLDSLEWGNSPCVCTLGILWHSEVDAFQFMFRHEEPSRWTLRTLASIIGKLYDPPCLLSPVTVQGKELLQLAWQQQAGWDHPLPEIIIKKARLYLKHHQHTENLLISRQAFGDEAELMIFTDASTQALAAAAYVVSKMEGRTVSRLLWAKHRLASIKGSETVPRLELAAAVMGTELAFFICKAFQWDLNRVTYFTDSITVLWWLQSTQALTPYVGNRLRRILERSSFRQWLHVRTEENPADLPTRGTQSERLKECVSWWEGPAFLKRDPSTWVEQPELYEMEAAAAEKRTVETLCRNIVMAARAKVQDRGPVAGWVAKILRNAHAVDKGCRVADLAFKAPRILSKGEVEWPQAKVVVWRSEQREHLGTLLWQLEKGKNIDKGFWELQPFLDQLGLIRINSRLTPYLEVHKSVAQPLLLHHKMEMAHLLAWETHAVQLKHCGGSGSLRAEYWIMGCAGLVKRVVSSCHFCARLNAKPYKLPLPPLHLSRTGLFVGRLQAFSEIGIDFAGPFCATIGRSQVKRYALIIVCCTTRAVNVEVCHSLNGKSCLAALDRHMARYGQPSYINSDNGANFLASSRHLEERIQVLRQPDIAERLRWTANIEWYFNPPASPTWTGHVECFVKMVKKALKCLKPRIKAAFDDEELRTLLVQTQGFINMRPLMNVHSDQTPLTPADFLLTGSPRLHSIPLEAPEKMTLESRKELIDANLRETWACFKEEYVLSLRKNVRLLPGNRQITSEDAVVLLDDEERKYPGQWRCGVVVDVHPGKDRIDRSFDILVGGDKIFKRNFRTLGRLPRPSLVPDGYLQ